jgi:Skp family chaperone for outer membrane proteins
MKLTMLQKSGRYFVFLMIIGFAWMSLGGAVWAKELKVGFYDLERLKYELPFFQKLNEVFKAKDAELELFRGNLYKEYMSFYNENTQRHKKEASGKSAAEQDQIAARFQTELNNKIKEMNDQLEKKRLMNEEFKKEQIQATNDRIDELVAAVSAKKKLALVVEKSSVLYGGTDITQDIIKKVQKDAKQDKTE